MFSQAGGFIPGDTERHVSKDTQHPAPRTMEHTRKNSGLRGGFLIWGTEDNNKESPR